MTQPLPLSDDRAVLVASLPQARLFPDASRDIDVPDTPAEILRGVMQAARMAVWLARTESLELIEFRGPGGRDDGFGLAPEQVAPRVLWTDNVYPPDRSALRAYVNRPLFELASTSVDYRLMVGDGELLWVRQWTIARHTLADGDIVLRNVIMPISEQKQLEWECLRVSERERNRIGQELHDDLCQVLSGLLLMLQVVAQRARPADASLAHELEELAQHFGATTDRVRAMAHGLFPAQLNHASAAAALEACAAGLRALFQVEIAVHVGDDVPRHDPAQILQLFRLTQEAVANAVRHGGATAVRVALVREGCQLRLTIEDNGTGMPAAGGRPEGIGMHVMQYRAQALGGACEFRPAAPHGVVVHVYYPLTTTATH